MRVGERILVRRASLRFMQSVARSVGLRITQRAIGQGGSINYVINLIDAGEPNFD